MLAKDQVLVSHSSPHFSVHKKLGDIHLAIAEITYFGTRDFTDVSNGLPVYYFNRLNVPEKYRGQGVGKELLLKLLDLADLLNFCILLEVSSSDPNFSNENLISFYQRYGFKLVEGRQLHVYLPNTRQ